MLCVTLANHNSLLIHFTTVDRQNVVVTTLANPATNLAAAKHDQICRNWPPDFRLAGAET